MCPPIPELWNNKDRLSFFAWSSHVRGWTLTWLQDLLEGDNRSIRVPAAGTRLGQRSSLLPFKVLSTVFQVDLRGFQLYPSLPDRSDCIVKVGQSREGRTKLFKAVQRCKQLPVNFQDLIFRKSAHSVLQKPSSSLIWCGNSNFKKTELRPSPSCLLS